ncbi:terminase small subunit [Halopseudomonas sp.]|uniref:terminase small subunit n=1 Tax=Halopseudomonas sp. TaxID=2901191 RepID=UPI0031203D06
MALTEQKRRYAAARLSGLGKKASALEAGCPEKTASQAASRYEKDPDVLALMARTVAVEESRQEKPGSGVDAHIPAAADDPLEFFKSMMNDPAEDPKLRLDAAKSLAAYTVAKPGDKGKKEDKADAAKKATRGKFGAAPPPLHAVK